MKKILLVVCFLMISLATFAQMPSIGVKGGLNFASMSNSSDGIDFAESSIKTFNAGVFVDIKFGNFSLQPALNYTGKGGNYTETYSNPPILFLNINSGASESNVIEDVKEQLYYLELPVNFVYHVPVIIGNIYFGAGPYIAEGLSGKTTIISSGNTTQNVTFGNSASDIKATQFGADAIIGFKLRGGLLINANYDYGLTNDLPAGANGDKSKSRVFGISLGYVFL